MTTNSYFCISLIIWLRTFIFWSSIQNEHVNHFIHKKSKTKFSKLKYCFAVGIDNVSDRQCSGSTISYPSILNEVTICTFIFYIYTKNSPPWKDYFHIKTRSCSVTPVYKTQILYLNSVDNGNFPTWGVNVNNFLK